MKTAEQLTLAFPTRVVDLGEGRFLVTTGRPKAFLSVGETCARLELCRKTVYALLDSGDLDGRKKTRGRTSPWRISVASIERFEASTSSSRVA